MACYAARILVGIAVQYIYMFFSTLANSDMHSSISPIESVPYVIIFRSERKNDGANIVASFL